MTLSASLFKHTLPKASACLGVLVLMAPAVYAGGVPDWFIAAQEAEEQATTIQTLPAPSDAAPAQADDAGPVLLEVPEAQPEGFADGVMWWQQEQESALQEAIEREEAQAASQAASGAASQQAAPLPLPTDAISEKPASKSPASPQETGPYICWGKANITHILADADVVFAGTLEETNTLPAREQDGLGTTRHHYRFTATEAFKGLDLEEDATQAIWAEAEGFYRHDLQIGTSYLIHAYRLHEDQTLSLIGCPRVEKLEEQEAALAKLRRLTSRHLLALPVEGTEALPLEEAPETPEVTLTLMPMPTPDEVTISETQAATDPLTEEAPVITAEEPALEEAPAPPLPLAEETPATLTVPVPTLEVAPALAPAPDFMVLSPETEEAPAAEEAIQEEPTEQDAPAIDPPTPFALPPEAITNLDDSNSHILPPETRVLSEEGTPTTPNTPENAEATGGLPAPLPPTAPVYFTDDATLQQEEVQVNAPPVSAPPVVAPPVPPVAPAEEAPYAEQLDQVEASVFEAPEPQPESPAASDAEETILADPFGAAEPVTPSIEEPAFAPTPTDNTEAPANAAGEDAPPPLPGLPPL